MNRTCTVRLYPTKEQELWLETCSDAARFVWNLLVEAQDLITECDRSFGDEQYARRIAKGEIANPSGRSFGSWSTSREGNIYRVHSPRHLFLDGPGAWMNDLVFESNDKLITLSHVPRIIWMRLGRVHRSAFSAYSNLTRGRPHYHGPRSSYGFSCPSHKSRGETRRPGTGGLKENAVRIPRSNNVKLSNNWVKSRGLDKKFLAGEPVLLSFHRDRARKWFCTAKVELEEPPLITLLPNYIGIDMGITDTIMLSDGRSFNPPDSLAKTDRLIKIRQKKLDAKTFGSKSWNQEKRLLGRAHIKRKNIIHNWCHEISTELASDFGNVAVENLDIARMTKSNRGSVKKPGKEVARKSDFNRKMLSQNWGLLGYDLSYKVDERSGTFVRVDPKFTSTTCSFCDSSRTVRDGKKFECKDCEVECDADFNAARNILFRAFPELTEDAPSR